MVFFFLLSQIKFIPAFASIEYHYPNFSWLLSTITWKNGILYVVCVHTQQVSCNACCELSHSPTSSLLLPPGPHHRHCQAVLPTALIESKY